MKIEMLKGVVESTQNGSVSRKIMQMQIKVLKNVVLAHSNVYIHSTLSFFSFPLVHLNQEIPNYSRNIEHLKKKISNANLHNLLLEMIFPW